MKYLNGLLALLCSGCLATAQTPLIGAESDLNFGFERLEENKPAHWLIPYNMGSAVQLDSLVRHRGEHSVCMTGGYGDRLLSPGIYLRLPHLYGGDSIVVTAYIRTENVRGGQASLCIRQQPGVATAVMKTPCVTGTTDWKKYTVRAGLDPGHTQEIVVGGFLSGSGKMWLDDIEVKIDRKPLWLAPVFVRHYPGETDTAFQKGSGVRQMAEDPQTLRNLQVLGLVWGYLKFYHPKVGAGAYNWANQLFRLLPEVSAAKSDAARDHILSDFIHGLGPVKKMPLTDTAAGRQRVRANVDTSWWHDGAISRKLAGQLSEIYFARRPDINYYYIFKGAGNVVFPHDPLFPAMRTGDLGMRLLALYRYWNAIEYFFPYRYLIKNWQQVLAAYIPVMMRADSRLKYELALASLVAKIKDGHGGLYGGQKISGYFGLRRPALGVAYIEGKWVVNRYLDSLKSPGTGIRIGDIIRKVDGRDVDSVVGKLKPLTAASNAAGVFRNISWLLLNTNRDAVTLTFDRSGQLYDKVVKTFETRRLPIHGFADVSKAPWQRLTKDIGYIYPATISDRMAGTVMAALADTKGLIIDFRCYPKEDLLFALGPALTAHPVRLAGSGRIDPSRPGSVRLEEGMILGKENPDTYPGKLVILVNEYTQSSAEYMTMAFQAMGATVIGSATAGADGNVSVLPLPGKMGTPFSGLGIYYPDGRETQQVGIAVDIPCAPTIKGVRAGRDELLERAVRFIRTGK